MYWIASLSEGWESIPRNRPKHSVSKNVASNVKVDATQNLASPASSGASHRASAFPNARSVALRRAIRASHIAQEGKHAVDSIGALPAVCRAWWLLETVGHTHKRCAIK